MTILVCNNSIKMLGILFFKIWIHKKFRWQLRVLMKLFWKLMTPGNFFIIWLIDVGFWNRLGHCVSMTRTRYCIIRAACLLPSPEPDLFYAQISMPNSGCRHKCMAEFLISSLLFTRCDLNTYLLPIMELKRKIGIINLMPVLFDTIKSC